MQRLENASVDGLPTHSDAKATSSEPLKDEAPKTSKRAAVSVLADNSSIKKPDVDNRTYRLLRLPNELEVLLVHDAESEKAAAALDVNVGSLCDFDGWDGLAHFLEVRSFLLLFRRNSFLADCLVVFFLSLQHMLFMGTETYPVENDYSDFLAKHSGYSNAFTGPENTNYYFEGVYFKETGATPCFPSQIVTLASFAFASLLRPTRTGTRPLRTVLHLPTFL